MSLHEIYDYFRRYDKKAFSVFAQQGSEPSPADVDHLESTIGFSLPDEFREFAVHPLGGLYMEVQEEIWPRGQEYDVGPFWSFLYGFFVYSLSPDSPDWMRIENGWREMAEAGSPGLVPFLRVISDPDPYCFAPGSRILIWRHEAPDEPDEVQQTFSECVIREIRDLEDRMERKLRGEGRQ